jgi:hypothetical protein
LMFCLSEVVESLFHFFQPQPGGLAGMVVRRNHQVMIRIM